MFAWFDAVSAKNFGAELARYFIERVPSAERNNDKKFERKTKKTLDSMAMQAREYTRANPLNIYKRAQLLNQFKWTLKEADFEDAYIEKMTRWLIGLL